MGVRSVIFDANSIDDVGDWLAELAAAAPPQVEVICAIGSNGAPESSGKPSSSLLVALIAFAYAVFLVVYKIVHGQTIQGWSSLMVAVAFFSGVQLLSLGVLGEYVWRTLDAARGRKGFLVRERTE